MTPQELSDVATINGHADRTAAERAVRRDHPGSDADLIADLRADLGLAIAERKRTEADVVELRAERERARQSMEKLQADIERLRSECLAESGVINRLRNECNDVCHPQKMSQIKELKAKINELEQSLTAVAVERDALRREKKHLTDRLEEEKRRVSMAQKCLDDGYTDTAISVLDEKDVRRECERCGYPCDVEGVYCLFCGHNQPNEPDGPGIEDSVAAECNLGRNA
jgi:chromosome segregation ATPase